MNEAKFKIGDRVKPIHQDTVLEVMDAMYSIRCNKWFYDAREPETMVSGTYMEDDLEPAPEKKDYSMEIKIDIAKNVVIATLYESVGGGAEAHPQRTRSSDPRGREGYCPGCKLCLHETVQEHGRV